MDNCFFAYQNSPYTFHCYFTRLLEIIDFKIFFAVRYYFFYYALGLVVKFLSVH